MYCPNCHTCHDANSRYCSACGAQLIEPQPGSQQVPPPYGAAQPPSAQPSNVLPIVSLIISIFFGNLIGILLGAFSLVNFNRASAALQQYDYAGAETFRRKSKSLATAAIVVSVICCVLAVIGVIAAIVFGVFTSAGIGAPIVEFNYGDPQIPMMLASLLA